jgi:hypothetical protein
MLKATPQEREQIATFFRMITEYFNDILLYPVIDEKTGTERMAICIADREEDTVYVVGLWFLEDDSLADRMVFKEDVPKVLNRKPPGFLRRRFWKLRNFVRHFWT